MLNKVLLLYSSLAPNCDHSLVMIYKIFHETRRSLSTRVTS